MARTLARAHAGQTTERRPVRLSTSTIQPSGASSSLPEGVPHSEQVAITDNGIDGALDRYGGAGPAQISAGVGSDHEPTLLRSPP